MANGPVYLYVAATSAESELLLLQSKESFIESTCTLIRNSKYVVVN